MTMILPYKHLVPQKYNKNCSSSSISYVESTGPSLIRNMFPFNGFLPTASTITLLHKLLIKTSNVTVIYKTPFGREQLKRHILSILHNMFILNSQKNKMLSI